MAADRKLKVEILGDARGLSKATSEADGALGRFESGIGRLAKGAALAGAGLIGIGAAAFSMANAAAEDEKAAAALAKTLQNVTGATDAQVAAMEDWISAQGRALGVADDQLRPALDALVRGTGDLTAAQELASLAMDISAGTGKDLQSVSEALSKAYNGNFTALKKLDPALADLIKSGASADEVFGALGQTFEGQAAAGAETAAGKLAIAKLQFAEMQEEIGAKLIPVLSALASFVIDDLIPAIEDIVGALDRFGEWVGSNWEVISAAFTGLAIGVATVLVPAFVAWAASAGAAAIATLAAAAPVIAVGAAVAALAAGIVYLWQNNETFRTVVLAVWDAVKQAVTVAIEIVKQAIDIWILQFEAAWAVVQAMWDVVGPLIEKIGNVIREVVGMVVAIFTGDWSKAWEHFKAAASGAIELVVDWFIGLPARLLEALASLAQDLWDKASDALGLNGFLGGLGSMLGEITTWFTSLPGKILGWIGNIAQKFYDLGRDMMQKLLDGILGMLDRVRGAVQRVLDALNPLNNAPGGKAVGVGIPSAQAPAVKDAQNLMAWAPDTGLNRDDWWGKLASSPIDAAPTVRTIDPAGSTRVAGQAPRVSLTIESLVIQAAADPYEGGRQFVAGFEEYVRFNGLPAFLQVALA